ERDRLSRLDRKRHVLQDPLFVLISEPDVLKLDAPFGATSLFRLRRRGDRYGQIERAEDAMRRDHRRLQHVVLIRDVADRLKELLRVLNESDERAERERLMRARRVQDAIAAEPDDECDADSADQIHE